ncbi:NAD(P)-dependent oxidoreductase [Streptomyces sp. NPDC058335]|uniref:NAD(P)-dependent oxidoreductase n=1 Tax=Streptomyces sp. NPDC058335 TaxID=3346451 RepID=UPI003656D4F4
MNVTVFGATGAIGSLTVTVLLEHGHQVTAYARNPDKVPGSWGERVRVVVGEMSDQDAVDSAVAGADAVVSALGPSMDRKATGLPLVAGTGHILTSMKRHHVRAREAHPGHPPHRLHATHVHAPRLRRDHRHERPGHALGPGLDRRALHRSQDTPKQNRVRVGFFGTDKLGFAVSRADIAAFTAAQVDDDTYVGRAPAISN